MTFKTFFKRHWDEAVVYVLSLGAAILSNNLESFKAPGEVVVDLSVGRLGMAAFLALFVSFLMEVIPFNVGPEEKEAARRGKRKTQSLMRRFTVACVAGFAAPHLVDALVKGLLGIVGA